MTYVIRSGAKYLNPSAFNFTPLPSPPPLGGNNNLRHTERSRASQSGVFRLTPHPYPLLKEREKLKKRLGKPCQALHINTNNSIIFLENQYLDYFHLKYHKLHPLVILGYYLQFELQILF